MPIIVACWRCTPMPNTRSVNLLPNAPVARPFSASAGRGNRLAIMARGSISSSRRRADRMQP
eukprot:1195137-Prorocentrum_minimum.AAC.2